VASRAALGACWPEFYLTSPLWRFALASGACGPNAVGGVMMPSVDGVGRYFPLMVGREFIAGADLSGLVVGAEPWYEAVEALALATLRPEFPLEALDKPLPQDAPAPIVAPIATEPPPRPCQHVALSGSRGLAELCRELAGGAARRQTLWWTSGSEHIAPCLLICSGMPPAGAFASLLDGDWPGRGWLMTMPTPTAHAEDCR
jgi:type VI secretion system protein ImpM